MIRHALPVTAALAVLVAVSCQGAAEPTAFGARTTQDRLFYDWQFTDEPFDTNRVADLARTLEHSESESTRRSAAQELGELCFGYSFWSMRFHCPNRAEREAMVTAVRQGRTGRKAKALVPVLARALADDSPHVRKDVAYAFVMIGPVGADAGPALRIALDDADASVRLWAARALHFVTLEVDGPLRTSVAGLDDPEWQLRSMAAYNLELMERDAVPALEHLVRVAESDVSEDVRRQARQAANSLARIAR
jgi:hypothetical protein